MKTVFRYRLTDNLRSLAVLIAAWLFIPFFLAGIGDGAMNAVGTVGGAVWALVIGIVALRVDLRLGNQMGVGRRSAFLGSLLGNAASFAAGAVSLTALTGLLQLLTDGSRIVVMDLYQMLYSKSPAYVMPFGDYAAMALMQLALFLCLGFFGMLCTVSFWRLGRLGQWVLGIAMGLFFIVGAPNLFYRLEPWLLRPVRILTTDVWVLNALLLACAAAALLGTWLLSRRASILAPAKT